MLAWPSKAEEKTAINLELVLAIDVSASVDEEEFFLQREGLAAAFRDPQVHAALASASGGIAVTVLQWSRDQAIDANLGWRYLVSRDDALAFADLLSAMPRLISAEATGLASALDTALFLFESNDFEGERKVVDVSADGRDNAGGAPHQARDLATASGVTINALVILNEIPYLQNYYHDYVIGGAGAFIMTASDYVDFARAIREKLAREIGAGPLS